MTFFGGFEAFSIIIDKKTDPLKLTLTIMSDRMSFIREYKLYKDTDNIF